MNSWNEAIEAADDKRTDLWRQAADPVTAPDMSGEQYIEAILEAFALSARGPSGPAALKDWVEGKMVLVPIVPTEAMRKAGADAGGYDAYQGRMNVSTDNEAERDFIALKTRLFTRRLAEAELAAALTRARQEGAEEMRERALVVNNELWDLVNFWLENRPAEADPADISEWRGKVRALLANPETFVLCRPALPLSAQPEEG